MFFCDANVLLITGCADVTHATAYVLLVVY